MADEKQKFFVSEKIRWIGETEDLGEYGKLNPGDIGTVTGAEDDMVVISFNHIRKLIKCEGRKKKNIEKINV